ncbi:MAG TPA: helix-turn-helix transcriptional regulator [Stellaceae bacterium]|jgi:XRE family aerobic/anaerobic benzoate catabolism transcriptional regulator|nr:helix-turn-helix transcriptional regulator [Stellaceae bacterium]
MTAPPRFPDKDDYLAQLGERVREERARRGMTRKILARDTGLSERYLAQLEAGRGNISIALLQRVAAALNRPLARLVGDDSGEPAELRQIVDLLRRLTPEQLAEVQSLIGAHFALTKRAARDRRIALIGLRGAGKSTLGSRLAHHLRVPFIELDAEIERDFGLSLAEIFALYDQPAYRRCERRVLGEIVEREPRFVLAAGGSIVAEPATYQDLLGHCFTVWLRAAPAEHMSRVQLQGDLRPMADNNEAMADLRRILAAREPLYAQADVTVDTAGHVIEASFRALLAALPQGLMKDIASSAESW